MAAWIDAWAAGLALPRSAEKLRGEFKTEAQALFEKYIPPTLFEIESIRIRSWRQKLLEPRCTLSRQPGLCTKPSQLYRALGGKRRTSLLSWQFS